MRYCLTPAGIAIPRARDCRRPAGRCFQRQAGPGRYAIPGLQRMRNDQMEANFGRKDKVAMMAQQSMGQSEPRQRFTAEKRRNQDSRVQLPKQGAETDLSLQRGRSTCLVTGQEDRLMKVALCRRQRIRFHRIRFHGYEAGIRSPSSFYGDIIQCHPGFKSRSSGCKKSLSYV